MRHSFSMHTIVSVARRAAVFLIVAAVLMGMTAFFIDARKTRAQNDALATWAARTALPVQSTPEAAYRALRQGGMDVLPLAQTELTQYLGARTVVISFLDDAGTRVSVPFQTDGAQWTHVTDLAVPASAEPARVLPHFIDGMLSFADAFADRKLSDPERAWIRWGATHARMPARMAQHSVEPESWSNVALVDSTPLPVTAWIHDRAAQALPVYEGVYTWEQALYDYATGDRQRAFEGLGHILSAMERAAMPAIAHGAPPFVSDVFSDWAVQEENSSVYADVLRARGMQPQTVASPDAAVVAAVHAVRQRTLHTVPDTAAVLTRETVVRDAAREAVATVMHPESGVSVRAAVVVLPDGSERLTMYRRDALMATYDTVAETVIPAGAGLIAHFRAAAEALADAAQRDPSAVAPYAPPSVVHRARYAVAAAYDSAETAVTRVAAAAKRGGTHVFLAVKNITEHTPPLALLPQPTAREQVPVRAAPQERAEADVREQSVISLDDRGTVVRIPVQRPQERRSAPPPLVRTVYTELPLAFSVDSAGSKVAAPQADNADEADTTDSETGGASPLLVGEGEGEVSGVSEDSKDSKERDDSNDSEDSEDSETVAAEPQPPAPLYDALGLPIGYIPKTRTEAELVEDEDSEDSKDSEVAAPPADDADDADTTNGEDSEDSKDSEDSEDGECSEGGEDAGSAPPPLVGEGEGEVCDDSEDSNDNNNDNNNDNDNDNDNSDDDDNNNNNNNNPEDTVQPNIAITALSVAGGTDEEFVRLVNEGDTAADMTGWTVEDVAGHTFIFPAFSLAAGASVTIYTGEGVDTVDTLYWGRGSAVWNNGGDTATLKNADGEVVAVLDSEVAAPPADDEDDADTTDGEDSPPAGDPSQGGEDSKDSEDGENNEDDEDSGEEETDSAPTITFTTIAFAGAADVEHIVLTNNEDAAIDMTGWTLADAANHVFTFPPFTLSPGAAVTVHTGIGTDDATNLYWGRKSAIWNDSGDTATLRDAAGEVIVTVTW